MTQQEALEILKTGQSVFLTGEPGSGKTHTVSAYISYLRAHGIEPAITASTGIAATHIHGMTLHSWSGIGIAQTMSRQDIDRLQHNKNLCARVRKAHVLIIDEVSMLAAQTLDVVDAVCRALRERQEPFGGLQVLLVGDFFQLPPVSKSREHEIQFAFESRAWQELDPTVCYLTEQHRQDDEDLVSILSAIRSGDYTEQHRGHLTRRIGTHAQQLSQVPRLFSHNADVDSMNHLELEKLAGHTKEFLMSTSGSEKYVEALKRNCLSPERLVLKIGAAVMCTKNSPEDGFSNGTLASVVGFSPATGYPIIQTFSGRNITVSPMEWMVEDDGKVKARINQIPLRLAWAVTIHKSQGMTMDAAVIDLSSAFEFGQGYVALSRVRRLSGLYLLGLNERALQVHPTVLEKDEEFRQRSAAATAGLEHGSAQQRQQAQQDFIRACGGNPNAQVGAPAGNSKQAQTKRIHQQAYKRWSQQDDTLLRTMFEADVAQEKIAEFFKRNLGAIRSRLKKLGLLY